jgi:catechol 2,3-dioxygenase-like lactoylglutathione lyase family enzyme
MSVDWDWTRIVLDHVHIRVQDAKASVAFYKAALEPLGIPPIWERENGAQLANLVVTDGEPRTSGPVHIAFVADSREQVDAFHRAGLEAVDAQRRTGTRVQLAGGGAHAAFLLDPGSITSRPCAANSNSPQTRCRCESLKPVGYLSP